VAVIFGVWADDIPDAFTQHNPPPRGKRQVHPILVADTVKNKKYNQENKR